MSYNVYITVSRSGSWTLTVKEKGTNNKVKIVGLPCKEFAICRVEHAKKQLSLPYYERTGLGYKAISI